MPDQSQGIGKGRQGFGVPGRLACGDRMTGQVKRMSHQGNPRKQPQQQWCRAGNRFVRPLALGFNAEMPPDLLKGDFNLPAPHKPLNDLERSNGWASTQQAHRFILTQRIDTGVLP